MSLQKPRKPYERKKREVTDGKYESGKKAGRPPRSPGELVRSLSLTLTPAQISDIRTLARIHFRGSMSACVSALIDAKLPQFWSELEEEWKRRDAERQHADPKVAKPKSEKKSEPIPDLGFTIVE